MFTTDDIRRTSTSSNEVIPKRIRPRDPSDSPNAYKNISVVKKLSKGKFPIYLTSSKVNKQNYAMKVFSHIGDNFDALYKNEIRFASLKHPNVIDMVHYENERETYQKGELKKVSYILMEYAPYGDLFNFILNYKTQIDEKLARTYFRQLIDGIEYLHTHAVAHLDLKPENLLLGSDFNLKIADFDLSHIYGDSRIMSRGTRYYRAPEFYKFSITSSSIFSSSTQMKLEVPFAADIYSAGIVLFVLMSGGMYPHAENKILNGVSFVDLMYQDNDAFWRKHCELQDRQASYYSSDFKELFNNMVKVNPRERLTLKQIKESKWYNGSIYTPVELSEKMKNVIN